MRRYGHPVFRVPVDPGWGCPNRDAAGLGGCTFCAEDGGRARQAGTALSVKAQALRGLNFAKERYRAEAFQLYLQAYTGTYARLDRFEALVTSLLPLASFLSISIGTRPDCLSREVIHLLQRWAETREIWIELGVQTMHDATLARVNRGHGRARSEAAVQALHDAGIHTCAHLLFGLPGETRADMLASVDWVVSLPFDGVKLHNLHVLRDAPLGQCYLETPFPVLSEPEYLELLMQALRRLPPEMPVFRLVTDSPPEQRLAPPQVMRKGEFLGTLARRMRGAGIRQGDQFSGAPSLFV